MATKVGYAADLYITSTPSVAFAQEATTADAGRLNYTITNTAKRYWDRGVTVLVENSTDAGATWHAAPPYTLNYCGGIVTFATARAVGELCRVSGNYYPWAQLGGGKQWGLSIANALQDTSVFGSGWKSFTPVVLGGSVKLARWWIDASFLTNLANPLVAILYVNQAAGTRYESFVRLKADSIKTAVAGVVDQSLDLNVDGAVNYYP